MAEPKLFFWNARGLYLGPAFGLRPHRNAVAVLCVSLDEPSGLAIDPRHPQRGYAHFTTALIPPNTLHHLRVAASANMAFLYVDAQSRDSTRLYGAMKTREGHFGIGLEQEALLIRELTSLLAGRSWREVRDALLDLLGLSDPWAHDPRIAEAVAHLQAFPGDSNDLGQAAARARLSPSRFQHLFKEETGIPYRRYRLWTRMGAALKALRSGRSLTHAAHEAGFSSSAHFSTAFAEMFGLPPSRVSGIQDSSLLPGPVA